ncbi:MAG: glucose-6-phosphate isomerase, partial [Halomonas sp.]|nr:glucose-6-phosphate isomerase [Halomonas sp.]
MNRSFTAENQRLYTPLNALKAHAEQIQAQSLTDLLGSGSDTDNQRAKALAFTFGTLHVDYSKQRVTATTLDLLVEWVRSCGLEAKRKALFAGAKVNASEKRAALHMAARWPATV